MIWLTFAQVYAVYHVEGGFGDKTREEIEALGMDLLKHGWDSERPMVVRRANGENFRHPIDGNHRLRALRHLKAWSVSIPVEFREVA